MPRKKSLIIKYVILIIQALLGRLIVFPKRAFAKVRVHIMRRSAQRNVQKMLKNNFIKTKKVDLKPKSQILVPLRPQVQFAFVPRAYRGIAAMFAITFLILTILTSQYYGPQFIEAEIRVQNFTESENVVGAGLDILKYETRTVATADSKAEFDSGSYSNGNFETGEDDLVAIAGVDDYLTIGSYGDHPADTVRTDWWDGEYIQTCSANAFLQGNFIDTEWDNTNAWVDLTSSGLAAGAGTYESDIIDAGSVIAWSDITWTSTRPTEKELPDALGVESVYSDGNVDMSDNILLVHLNESANPIADTSGVTGNGSYNGSQWNQGGKLGNALGFDGSDDIVNFNQDLSNIIGGTASMAFWMNTTQNGSNIPWNAPGITGSEQAGGGNDIFWGYITGSGHIAVQAGNIAGAESTTVINDGQWHHVVLTRNATSGEVAVYVDGFLEDTAISDTGNKTEYFDSIGRMHDSGGAHHYYQGNLDEVSFWSDVLTDEEVYDQYRRGANRLKFQVRSCDDAACSGESFIGPDGTGSTYYTELMNDTVNLPALPLTGISDNRYVQWRAFFETDNNTMSPELLCVTLNSNEYSVWKYRQCFTVDHTQASAADLTEYQIYLDFDTETLVTDGKMQSDGSDIRFIDSDENVLHHYVADDMNTASTRVWLEMDNIDAGETEEVCMYYGNTGAADIASREEVFTYQNREDIYYVVQDTANGSTTEFASYIDNNEISVETYNDTLNQYEADTHAFPVSNVATIEQTTGISTTDPISGGYGVDGADNFVPASFAGTAFVYRMDRGTNAFSFISPWCDANVEVRNENNNIVTNGSFTVTTGDFYNLTTDNNATTGLSNDSAVMIESTNSCPILVTHHATNGSDSFVMAPASEEWYGVGSGRLEIAALYDATDVTVYRSDGTTANYTLNRGDNHVINDAGSQGSEPAHRVVADGPIGVNSLADGDGGEATTFLPTHEMGYRYYFPEDMQYIAIATKEGRTTTVDLYNDGTACGTGTPDDTVTVTAAATYPGKAYFGSTSSGVHIAKGACIVADNPISAYYEEGNVNDEHNAWNEVQNKQFIYPTPNYTAGAEETGAWSIDGTHVWMRRVPITVNNPSSTNLTEYQMRIDLGADVSTVFGRAQSDGGDIRVAGSAGDGTDNITYSLENYDDTTNAGDMWIKFANIGASSSVTAYIYYQPTIDLSTYGPHVWLDALDTATLSTSGGNVSQWDDKSGNNFDAEASGNNQPTVITVGDNQYLQFASDHMAIDNGIWGTSTHNDSYVFAVFRNDVLPENGALFYENLSGGRYAAWSPWNMTVYYQQGNSGYLTAAYGGDTTDFHVMRYEAHSSGPRSIARDGTNIASDNNGISFTGSNSDFMLSGYPSGTYEQDITLGEFIVFDKQLTAAEVSEIETYLTEKWISGTSSALTTTGDHDAIFRTQDEKTNYYIVDNLWVGNTPSLISFADNNSVNDSANSETVDEGEIVTLPFSSPTDNVQAEVYSVNGPIHAAFTSDTTEAALPIAYAGTEFVYHVNRDTDAFSFYAPFADTEVHIQESGPSGWVDLQTVFVGEDGAMNVAQDITNNRAFRILSDEPILAFHRAGVGDSQILYPTHLALEEDSGSYELYGIGSSNMLLAASSDANVTIYRSNGTSSTIVLNSSNNFVYEESGSGAQGTAMGYHIVSDAPIGANSLADYDGIETVTFLSQKEFSDEYVLSQPAQYFSIVARDANVTCRVYDDTGAEVTTDSTGTMNNIPPQTGGTRTDPYINRIHIGGADTTDGAYFDAGYSLQCTEPVYAYYEHHLNAAVTDETSWLTWPQVRKRAYVEPVHDQPDYEEGLFYESGRDSTTTGNDFEAYAEYTLDTSTLTYGEHTYWRDITWEELVNSRSGQNGVEQVSYEVGYADPSPTCNTASYTYTSITPTVIASSVDTSNPDVTYTTNTQQAFLDDIVSDHSCVRVRIYLRTADQAYAPRIYNANMGYYVPTLLEDQLNSPTISVVGATSGNSERYRVIKAATNDIGLNNSEAFITFRDVSNSGVFTQADTELFEMSTQTVNSQFTFPPFPGTVPVSATTTSPFDLNNGIAVYFDHERTTGGIETLDYSFDVDISGAGGPQISRDFQLEVGGL
ncbi:MAG: hypothetical protein CR972_03110 [Candidatus Moraniibacteriota bacterium]|nr:MAG: hypothetical protein CR972_03110 [Candidatus Moranbacteria bacterium]